MEIVLRKEETAIISVGGGATSGENDREQGDVFMDWVRWMTVAALSGFLLEGFVLTVFPQQFQQLLSSVEPRTLQTIGIIETVIAIGLMAGLMTG